MSAGEQRAKNEDALRQMQHVGPGRASGRRGASRSERGGAREERKHTERWTERDESHVVVVIIIIIIVRCPGRECASTFLHLCRKCGREAGSDFHENKTGGRADRRGGCLFDPEPCKSGASLLLQQ